LFSSLSDDQFSTRKALQTVAAGQQAENLLDFDDIPSDQPSGLAATQVSSSTPAAANLLAGTSSNPLDDLVSIFGNMSATPAGSSMNVFGSPPAPSQQQNAFVGLGLGGAGSPITSQPSQPGSIVPPGQAKKADEDLLGLF
jgi:hypothetical protein